MATFDRDDTRRTIITIVADKLGIDKETIKEDSSFQDLGADSIDLVEIIMKMEEQFGMEINDEDAEKLERLDDVVSYIHERRTK